MIDRGTAELKPRPWSSDWYRAKQDGLVLSDAEVACSGRLKTLMPWTTVGCVYDLLRSVLATLTYWSPAMMIRIIFTVLAVIDDMHLEIFSPPEIDVLGSRCRPTEPRHKAQMREWLSSLLLRRERRRVRLDERESVRASNEDKTSSLDIGQGILQLASDDHRSYSPWFCESAVEREIPKALLSDCEESPASSEYRESGSETSAESLSCSVVSRHSKSGRSDAVQHNPKTPILTPMQSTLSSLFPALDDYSEHRRTRNLALWTAWNNAGMESRASDKNQGDYKFSLNLRKSPKPMLCADEDPPNRRLTMLGYTVGERASTVRLDRITSSPVFFSSSNRIQRPAKSSSRSGQIATQTIMTPSRLLDMTNLETRHGSA